MAFVNFDGLNLRVTLAPTERRAVHLEEFVVPRAHIDWVVHAPDIWDLVQHDISLMGLGFPRIILWGTAWTRHGRDFCILGKPGPGLAIGLREFHHDRVLLSMPDSQGWPLYMRLREITTERGQESSAAG